MIQEFTQSLIQTLTAACDNADTNIVSQQAIKNVLNDLIQQLPTFADNFLKQQEHQESLVAIPEKTSEPTQSALVDRMETGE